MIGTNKLIFNAGTMIEALQFWFDNVFIKESRVKVVQVETESVGSGLSFIITVEKAAP